jgi:hypothetical protein
MTTAKKLVLASAAVVLMCAGISSADPPGVTQKGRYVIAYDGPDLKAELIYRWASSHLGDGWLLLKLSMSSAYHGATTVERSSVTVRTPDGRQLPLIDQKTFRGIFPQLRSALETTDAWGPPARRLESSLRPCEFWYLTPPFSTNDRSTMRVFPGQWCSGPLVFRPPAGVQPGRWVLVIDLEESQVRIPFELEDNR